MAPGEINRHVRTSVHAGSSLYHLDSEMLEKLAPDLIVTQELCAVCAVSYQIVDRAAKQLSSDARIVSLEPASLDDVYANVATLGELTGSQAAAKGLIASLQLREDALRAKYEHHSHPRTLLLEWTDPPMSAGHWTPGLIEIAGGVPVLCKPGANSTVIDWDAVEQEAPDVILIAPCGFDLEAATKAMAELDAVPQFAQSRAKREARVFAIDGNAYVNRPGPRLIDTAEIFAGYIHGA